MKSIYLLLLWCYNTLAQTTYDVSLGNLLQMQQGIGSPPELYVALGNEALLKLAIDLDNQETCEITTPSGVVFDVRNPPNSKYESWSDGCGLRVRNVTKSDEGRWRLTGMKGNDNVTGWTEIYVLDGVRSYTGTPISLQDGEANAEVVLTSLDNVYCLVAQPFSDSSLVPGHCHVTLDRTTRAVQGNWSILLGMIGQVSELQTERKVAVEAERLDTGYIQDTNANKLHLYCNILHSSKNITFCRFQKTNEAFGYNIVDGLSDGQHSYYGDGFGKRHCGMTIETPTAQSLGSWRCTVGVQEWVGTQILQQNPMQALIRVASNDLDSRIRRDLRTEESEPTKVFVQKDMSYTIMCRAEVSLTYCWFQHPNGDQFTPVDKVDDDQPFWYTGDSLQTGDCGITFPHANEEDAGEWICHMGPRNQLGVEITDRVTVRVTGPLAANKNEITVEQGGMASLYCHTSNGNRPLVYCRFLSPSFLGISLDSSVTQDNAILDRFYFTPGRELQYGDCSMEINPVKYEDVGKWTCAALLDDETLESRDTISLHIESTIVTQFRADLMGVGIGLVILVGILGVVAWFKREKLILWRTKPSNTGTDAISLQNLSESSASRGSNVSYATDSSNERQNP